MRENVSREKNEGALSSATISCRNPPQYITSHLSELSLYGSGNIARLLSAILRSMQTLFLRSRLGILAPLVAAGIALPFGALAASFTDIPADSPLRPAAEYMASKGMMQEAPLFRPKDIVTRGQAVKVLVAALVAPEELKKITSSSFSDTPPGEWFTPYAEAARSLGIVDSAPTFKPAAPVTKAAFLKMLLGSRAIAAAGTFSDLVAPLASDVQNANDWFFPIMRYAYAASMIEATAQGTLLPGAPLTRGDMALVVYRLDMYRAGRRTQALLSETEVEIANTLQMLTDKKIDHAEWAASRAVLAARGALAAKPDEALVKGAVKVAEGFRSLVKGYKAGNAGQLDLAIASAKEAYGLADKARSFSPSLSTLANQMQQIAKNMADEARRLGGKG